ncbi:hypothetical protein [Ruegeria arenilitoris]|uniref:hypothetical protein n=1 Tax=Ruegeria arenilitoris TaxID=1173585 RepID=UPI00147AD7E0|nr:hypothetical protein [Ruegeria arenilitoris]
MIFDQDSFEERAAIMEYLGELSRFRAETLAAAAQGLTRWETLSHVASRVVEQARDQRSALAQQTGQGAMPEVQPAPAEEV